MRTLVKSTALTTLIALCAALIWLYQSREPYVYLPSTVSPEWQDALRTMRNPNRKRAVPAPDDLAGWQRLQAEREAAITVGNEALLRRLQPNIAEYDLGGVSVLEVTPRGWKDNGKVAVYTHGGAYTLLSARSTLAVAAVFAEATGLRVISVDYTVAPKGRWPRVLDEVVTVFKALRAQGYAMDRVALYGDSAGGGLAAGATLKMRDEGVGMPAALVLWSPWSDITETGDTYQTLKQADPMLAYASFLKPSADAYADPADQKNPYVSPVYGDFRKGFPPTLIQVGTKEIFLSNAVRQYQAIEAAGGTAKLDVYEGMPHVFQVAMPDSPEHKLAMRKVKAFLNQHLGP